MVIVGDVFMVGGVVGVVVFCNGLVCLVCRLVVLLVGVISGSLWVLNWLLVGVFGVVIGIEVMLLLGVGFLISIGRKIMVSVISMMVLIRCCFRGVFM